MYPFINGSRLLEAQFRSRPKHILYHSKTGNILSDAVQPCTVDSNLIIHLVRLVDDPVNVLVLCINLVAHGFTQHVKRASTAVDGVPGERLAIVQCI